MVSPASRVSTTGLTRPLTDRVAPASRTSTLPSPASRLTARRPKRDHHRGLRRRPALYGRRRDVLSRHRPRGHSGYPCTLNALGREFLQPGLLGDSRERPLLVPRLRYPRRTHQPQKRGPAMSAKCFKFESADVARAKGTGSISSLDFDLDVTVEPGVSDNPMAPTHRILGRPHRSRKLRQHLEEPESRHRRRLLLADDPRLQFQRQSRKGRTPGRCLAASRDPLSAERGGLSPAPRARASWPGTADVYSCKLSGL